MTFCVRRVERVDRDFVEAYSHDDWVLDELDRASREGDESLTSQRWLRQDCAKRAVFASLYRDLFSTEGLRVLDVGGGLSAFARVFSQRHDYVLVDMLAHDSLQLSREFIESCQKITLLDCDWDQVALEPRFDIVIANDLFPNVDQRLPVFLEFLHESTDDLRMSLTFYENHRFYRTKRVDADEILTMLAWDGVQTARAVAERCVGDAELLRETFEQGHVSAFANGRQVAIVWLSGVVTSRGARREEHRA